MSRFIDLGMSDAMRDMLWAPGSDGTMRSPLDAINDEYWDHNWLPTNDDDFGNTEIAASDSESDDASLTPEPR